MAAFNHFKNMYDVGLKPRLLRMLLKEHLPDDTNPFGNPAGISTVVSMIKTHGLLSESSVEESADQRICLLGVTCQECSSDRFLASYTLWFHKLLPFIQSPADSLFVKVATCASLSDMFTRLGGFPNQKKDGTSHAGKVIQPVLKLLNDDSSEAVSEGAVQLLCTIITCFPSSVHRHYDSAEAAVASKLLSGKCSADMLKKLAHCLALLPKSRGDEDSWSLMIQKILFLLNGHLNDVFQGLEEETKRNEATRLLVPPGKDAPASLGGHTFSGEVSDDSPRRSERLLMSSVSTLMLSCCTMLTSSYPVQVNIPVRSLLVLVERVLAVDGSLPQALLPFMTSMQQELICAELPVLHSCSLELLSAIIKGTRSQLLPHAASIVRLITSYLKRCALPELRIKVYSILRVLLISMGVGVAVCLAQDVINNVYIDLDPISSKVGHSSSIVSSKASSETLLQPGRRKRKHGTDTAYLEEQHDLGGLQVETPKNHSISPISLRVAALEALEALFMVGGALRSACWRSNVDLLLINTARNSLEQGWATEIVEPNESSASWVDFQLAALRALLASFLSSVHVRPPHLAQGLELFRRGKQETGTRLAEFCAHALLALEVLIHPRALPLTDLPPSSCNSFEEVSRKFSENVGSGGVKYGEPFAGGIQGIRNHNPSVEEDDLYESWLENGKETEAPDIIPSKNTRYNEEPPEALGGSDEENRSVDGTPGTRFQEKRGNEPATTSVDVRMRDNNDDIMVDADLLHKSIAQVKEPVSSKSATVPVSNDGSSGAEIVSATVVSGSGVSDHAGNVFASSKDVLAAEGDRSTTVGVHTSATTEMSEKTTGDAFDLDGEDPFPEIFDVEPDSDEGQD
ncbi:Proline-, glutamic acid- and leucine-rich protein 1 [Morella rubra]|uniref:Proline-, glutamic acid-and leucine-rich protein 1 n=1 Tax=Morella rubra TaxID=262757 RepID=A0A6A1VBT9_9ROSI|nr:Proline-, glutamic acid- and leucine-rich protein 1 [Morella rubra]